MTKQLYVYVMANRSRTVYVGVTNDIARRVWEHKHMQTDGFTRRYLIDRLVYYELAPDAEAAIMREKQIKGWVRRKKIALIESVNPQWGDLSEDFIDIRTSVPQGPFHSANRGRRDSSLTQTRGKATTTGVAQSSGAIERRAQNDAQATSLQKASRAPRRGRRDSSLLQAHRSDPTAGLAQSAEAMERAAQNDRGRSS